MSRREFRAGTSVLAFCIVFIAILVLPAVVSADNWVGGVPLTTVQTGSVTGDLWFDANPAPDWGSLNVVKTFTLPAAAVAEPGRIKWARLYISAYAGHMQNDYAFTMTTSFDGDGASGYEQVWPETGHGAFNYMIDPVTYDPLGNDNSEFAGHGEHEPYLMLNDHETRVTSDYFAYYDVTNMITSQTVNVNVDTTGSFDGRIKVITLVVAYDDPSSTTQTTYWVNQGHDVCSYYTETNLGRVAVGSTTFSTSGLSGITSATLTADYMASHNGLYGFPTSQNTQDAGVPSISFTNQPLATGYDEQGPYSGLMHWDVTSAVTGSDVTLGYSRDVSQSGLSAFYKIPLAFLVVKSQQPALAPVADFSADVTSGIAPLTVTFTDASSNAPTSWSWSFGDGGTSDLQNPSHEYTAAGTYTVTLTATNSAGSNTVTETNYIVVLPTIYATYLGGSLDDEGSGIAVDNAGNAYIVGYTSSTDFPVTSGAYQATSGGVYDIFVSKFNSAGNLVYSTYLGGSSSEYGYSIALDSTGNAYIAGSTSSADFPVTSGAFQAAYSGSQDAFLSKIDPNGALVYSTYLGGTSTDSAWGIALDGTGNIYVAGQTNSATFPTTSGAYLTTLVGNNDGFVSKFDSAGNLVYSTYLGGTGIDYAYGIAADSTGNAYVIGATQSTNFPVTGGVYQTTSGGGYDAFVSKLDPAGTGLVYSTYLGGSGAEYGRGITYDNSGNAYITGYTSSATFPVTSGAAQTTIGGGTDAFISELNPAGTGLIYSTYIGGSTTDRGYSIARDSTGNVYATGRTQSTNFPVTSGAYQSTGGGGYDTFMSKLNPGGGLSYSTYLGGTASDYGAFIALDGDGNPYVTGQSAASDFPTTGDAYQVAYGGGTYDAFMAKFGFVPASAPAPEAPVATFSGTPTSGTAPLTVTFTDTSANTPTSWAWTFGDGGTSNLQNPVHEYAAAGTYTVALTASNSAGSDIEEKTGYITVTPNYNPIAAFSGTPISGTAPLTVQFTDASTSLGSSEERVTNGDFETGTLYGWDVSSDNTGYSAYVSSISGNHAVIGFGGPEIGSGTVTLSQDVDLTDANSLSFSYQFTGGCDNEEATYTAEALIGDTVVWQTSTPNEAGAETANIDVSSYSGTQTVKFRVTVSGFDVPGESMLHLDNISAVSEGGISAWAWTFGDGGTSDQQNPSHEYAAAGTYTVTLMVTDANGSDSEVKEDYITVSPAVSAPVSDFTGTPSNGNAPLTVQFTDASSNAPTSWSWTFGDGGTSDQQNPSHEYIATGTYTVTLTATNSGGSDDETKTDYITVTAIPQIDLTISGLVNTVPASAVFARETNPVTVINVKNQGTDPATDIVVAVYASDISTTVPVATTTIASLAAGATSTVTVIDPTIRNLEGGTVTYTAIVDPDNLITEMNEANNNKASTAKPLKYNGYKGKGIYWDGGSNITTKHIFDLRGDVVYYTQSDAYYKAVDWTSRTETWTAAELPVPEGATIEKVYLYIAYNWDQTPAGVPDMNAVFNGNTLALGTPYMDKSNFGAYADYEYGLYPAIDVTSQFSRNGDNTLVMTPNAGNREALYPSTIVVVYSDLSETRKQIFINEECDELGVSYSSYGTTSDEAIAYAEFSGMTIDIVNVQSATLSSFAGSAGPGEGNLTFNGVQIGTDAWQGTSSTGSAQSFDVKNYLAPDGNLAGIQGTTSGGMDALEQILVVEYAETAPVAAFSSDPASGTVPLTVLFTDTSSGNPTGRVWDFGDGNSTWSTTETTFAHTYESAGTYDVALTVTNAAGSDSETKDDYITVTAGILTIPGQTNPPTDPDSDGLYEDLSGNGDKDFKDVQLYFGNMAWIKENEPIALFDFSGNSDIDFKDVQMLFAEI